jgi:hypothetical protein
LSVWAEAKALLANTPDSSPASKLWTLNTQCIAEVIRAYPDERGFIHWLTSVNFFTSPHMGSLMYVVADKWLALLERPVVEESPYANPLASFWRDFRLLSTACLQANYYAQQVDTVNPVSILEIGAGYGVLARVLSLKAPRRYTILDLPVSLFCSYVFLRTHFPEKACIWVQSQSDLDSEADFHFVPASLAMSLASQSYDMAINTCSMGEMLPENRDDYLRLIGATSRHFYSHNREGERFHTLPADTALPAITLDNRWEYLFDETMGRAQVDPELPPSRELLVRRSCP